MASRVVSVLLVLFLLVGQVAAQGGAAASKFCMKCGNKLPAEALFCSGCGAKQPAMEGSEPAKAGEGAERVEAVDVAKVPKDGQPLLVTIVGATIAPRKADGRDWDFTLIGGGAKVIGKFAPIPPIAREAAEQVVSEISGKSIPAPDAFLVASWGLGTVKSDVVKDTFDPMWTLKVPFQYSSDRSLTIQLWDKDLENNDAIGQIQLTGPSAFSIGTHNTGPFGQVLGCQYTVEPLPIGRLDNRTEAEQCAANCKTLAGALEMYNLDFKTEVTVLDIPMLERLKKEGYLQSLPKDPGQGPDSAGNYILKKVGDAWRVECRVHGPSR